MKKLLSIILAALLIFSVFTTVPTVFAEEAEYTFIDETYGKTYWSEIYEAYKNVDIIKSGDWYFALDINGESFTVCGYDGEESDITIPTKLNGAKIYTIRDFYLISNTVKTIRIPAEIICIDDLDEYGDVYQYGNLGEYNDAFRKTRTPVFEGESPVENIIVDSGNPYYASQDGVLFTKEFVRLIYYPINKVEEKYVVPDTVKYITNAAFADAKNLKSLTITPSVVDLGYASIPKNGLEQLYFVNTALPKYEYYLDFIPSEDRCRLKYIPNVPDTVVYCVESSELHKVYEQSLKKPNGMCKELKELPPSIETLKKENGKWYHYCNDCKMKTSNTLVKYNGKWFYVTNGVWDKTVNDKIISYKDKWFYINNGKWNSGINTLIKKDGNWFHIKNGKWDITVSDLVKYEGKWFYATKGKWDKNINTLFKKNGKWFAVKNGKWYKGESIIKYSGKEFYVNKGFVQFNYSGKVKINGKTYKIKNGKVA